MSEGRTLTSKEASVAIQHCFNKKRPVFLWGPPGIGKSELVEEMTRDMNGYMIDLRLSQMEPTDLRGFPFYNKDNDTMDLAPPIDLPTEELASPYPVLVLFLHDCNSVSLYVMASAYQLIITHRIGI